MRKIWNWIKSNPNRAMFLIPILLVAGISISHVVTWYDIANPYNWAIYLSIAIEIGAMTALVAATNKIKGGVWFMFGLVTLIQMIGNIFYSYKEIDATGDLFKSWVELTGPFWDLFTDSTDVISMKRWLAFLEGGLLPIISLTSLHFFVKYEKPEEKEKGIKLTDEDRDSINTMIDEELPKEEKEESRVYNIEIKDLPTKEEQEVYIKEITEKFKQPIEFEEEPKINPLEVTEDVNYFDGYPIPVKEEENTEIIQSERDAEVFVNEIEDPTPPNEILQNALKKYKQSKPQNNSKSNIRRID
jgi:hypothetical protein